MIIEVLANLALDLRDLLVERGDDLRNGSRDDGCLLRITRTPIAARGSSSDVRNGA
jgi:hypothetical protein